jgi:hypothetical protein
MLLESRPVSHVVIAGHGYDLTIGEEIGEHVEEELEAGRIRIGRRQDQSLGERTCLRQDGGEHLGHDGHGTGAAETLRQGRLAGRHGRKGDRA